MLTDEQIKILYDAIRGYNYPARLYDFEQKQEIMFETMRELENYLRKKLLSTNPLEIKFGLANVVYWGNLTAGYCWRRVQKFLNEITLEQIRKATTLFSKIEGDGLLEIKKLNLPQFSNMSFSSKLRMFLDPCNYVALDRKLLKLKKSKIKTFFHFIKEYPTYIPITKQNCELYRFWSKLCRETAKTYFKNTNFIAVDIERGIFHLVDRCKIDTAAMLVKSMAGTIDIGTL